ncbi:MBL fold metallo-hydrolase [Geothermobacter hydrogeniphilus]|uniref:Uncharacterized protein n=1 Tax=Geothermobacter hydrogeniphilus TaxID=1969733 RepID=A0A1X0Y816_9BACT|nr:MBL fold metallo-hydrolase [Geothermobacter hydrogeniphilus]ORJ61267.1 hypothetical protein B5V00_06415 [Geothermobacter hydrogeniphilus]
MDGRVFFRLVNGPFGDPALYLRLPHQPDALLFDCGDLHPLAPRACLKVRRVFISHAHIDHLAGFDQLLRLSLYRDLCLQLYGPPGLVAQIDHRLRGYSWKLLENFPFVLRVTEWSERLGRCAQFSAARAFVLEELPPVDQQDGWLCRGRDDRVSALPFDHGGVLSLGFRFEQRRQVVIDVVALQRCGLLAGPWLGNFKRLLREQAPGDTRLQAPLADGGMRDYRLDELSGEIARSRAGVKVCYVTDLQPTEANLDRVVSLARGADLLAIEAPFLHCDVERARKRNHLTARLAGEAAGRAGVGRLLVFHHSPRYQDQPRALWREAERARREAAAAGG